MTLPEKIEKLKAFFQAMRELEWERYGYEDRAIDNSNCSSSSYYVRERAANAKENEANLALIAEAEEIIFGTNNGTNS